jgi:uncharacterized membrane protein YdfJ with MMPL/SSD domain
VFAAIARFDARFRWLIVAGWFIAVIAGVRTLPGLSTVTHSSNAQFLSPSSRCVQASRLAAPFHAQDPSQTATIVAYRASGPLTAAERAAMGEVEQAARRVPGVSAVTDHGTSADARAAEPW